MPRESGEQLPLSEANENKTDRILLDNIDVDELLNAAVTDDIFSAAFETGEKAGSVYDALLMSISLYGGVAIPYIAAKCGISEQQAVSSLKDAVYQNPEKWDGEPWQGFETADMYLSGNIRQKLIAAQKAAESLPSRFFRNVSALEKAMPEPVAASDIKANLGAAWIPPSIIEHFALAMLGVNKHFSRPIVAYDEIDGEWHIEHKNASIGLTSRRMMYGTSRMSALTIIEKTLNQQSISVYTKGKDGKSVFDGAETANAREKQELIKRKFEGWIFRDAARRDFLVKRYNETCNVFRRRSYNGRFLELPGANDEISLYPYQRDAIARILQSGNTLLAHAVGAGKTFVMAASIMERRRLKPGCSVMCVVPNHIITQWKNEFLQLYPDAKLLTLTPAEFTAKKRARALQRIKNGGYDAVIMGFTSFEAVGVSPEILREFVELDIAEVEDVIKKLKNPPFWLSGKYKKTLEALKKKHFDLQKTPPPVMLTFDKLSIDYLYIDESHYYKNLRINTKMGAVKGVATAGSKKCDNLLVKLRCVQRANDGNGVVFATGTPVTNSMAEVYNVQKYLQFGQLKMLGLHNFDSWAATFGEVVPMLEISPTGGNYRVISRFARFFNLPELMNLFDGIAEIKLIEDLAIDTPDIDTDKGGTVVLPPTARLRDYIRELEKRADDVYARKVSPKQDNMLMITTDGRRAALDMRLVDHSAADSADTKVSVCAEKLYSIWNETAADKKTQMVFCDQSVPRQGFNVYDDLKGKLVAKGVPPAEIAFVHDAVDEAHRERIYSDVRSGKIRILIGSTPKMGIGTNVQDKMIALHHLDVPWRPTDIQQREGRVLRQGNENENVRIFKYVVEGSFDAYSWQMVENKQRFISQIMKGNKSLRSAEDIDELVLSYAEVKALATMNPRIKEYVSLQSEITRLLVLKAEHTRRRFEMLATLENDLPKRLAEQRGLAVLLPEDIERRDRYTAAEFRITLGRTELASREEAGRIILQSKRADGLSIIGGYRGFDIALPPEQNETDAGALFLFGKLTYRVELGDNPAGVTARMDNILRSLDARLESANENIIRYETDLSELREETQKEFEYEERLAKQNSKLKNLRRELGISEDNEND